MGKLDTPAESIRKQITVLEQTLQALRTAYDQTKEQERENLQLRKIREPVAYFPPAPPVYYVQVIVPEGRCTIDPWYKVALRPARGDTIVPDEGRFKGLNCTVIRAQTEPPVLSYIYTASQKPVKTYHGFAVGDKVRSRTRAHDSVFTVCERPIDHRALGYPSHFVPCKDVHGSHQGFAPDILSRV